jgi:hypothetical protein
MPYPDPPVDPLPTNFVGAGTFTSREADATRSARGEHEHDERWDGATLLSYSLRDLESLGGAAYQNAEFKANVTYTAGACTAEYTVQALSPAVGCESDEDCDPFKQPFSSGIFSTFDQGCHKEPGRCRGHLPRRLGRVLLQPALPEPEVR